MGTMGTTDTKVELGHLLDLTEGMEMEADTTINPSNLHIATPTTTATTETATGTGTAERRGATARPRTIAIRATARRDTTPGIAASAGAAEEAGDVLRTTIVRRARARARARRPWSASAAASPRASTRSPPRR
jgi:hypothetical protein